MLATTVNNRLRLNNPAVKETSVARKATEHPKDVVSLLEMISAVIMAERMETGTNESQLLSITGKLHCARKKIGTARIIAVTRAAIAMASNM